MSSTPMIGARLERVRPITGARISVGLLGGEAWLGDIGFMFGFPRQPVQQFAIGIGTHFGATLDRDGDSSADPFVAIGLTMEVPTGRTGGLRLGVRIDTVGDPDGVLVFVGLRIP